MCWQLGDKAEGAGVTCSRAPVSGAGLGHSPSAGQTPASVPLLGTGVAVGSSLRCLQKACSELSLGFKDDLVSDWLLKSLILL